MTSTLIIFVVAASALAAVGWLLFGHRAAETGCERPRPEIDLGILEVLLNPEEERYMRRQLSASEFNAFARRRIRATLSLVGMAEDDARRLIASAQRARAQGDPALRNKADKLIVSAIEFCANSWLTRFCLWLKWVYPFWAVPLPGFEERYHELWNSFAQMEELKSWVPV